MNKNSNYYQKIFDKFGSKDDQKILPQTNHTCIENIDQSNKINDKYVSLPSKSIYSIPKSKRGLKLIRKEHYENIMSYLSTQKKLSHNTFAEYIHVISDYLKFSPDCEIGDYDRYLRTLARQKEEANNEKLIIKGSQIKHARLLKKYLHYVYGKETTPVEIEYYKKPLNVEINPYPKIEKSELFKFYSKLIESSKVEDAVLLHLMFSLGFEPYTVSLLKFESISEGKKIKYFDHKKRSSIEISLTNELYGDLMFLKTFKKLKGELNNSEERRSLDGSIIKGTFIFSTSPTGIYNKFKRKFGGMFEDFDLTPKELIVLSKYYARKGDTKFYP